MDCRFGKDAYNKIFQYLDKVHASQYLKTLYAQKFTCYTNAEKIGEDQYCQDATDAAKSACTNDINSLVADMESRREEFIKESSPLEFEYALQNVRFVNQNFVLFAYSCKNMSIGFNLRDECMFDLWFLAPS